MNQESTPGVLEVQLLLDKWDLPALKEKFAEEEITVRVLECLQEDDKGLEEIIPKFGTRKIFLSCLKQWKRERDFGTNHNAFVSNSFYQSSVATSFNSSRTSHFDDSQPTTSGIVEQAVRKTSLKIDNKSTANKQSTQSPNQTKLFNPKEWNINTILNRNKAQSSQIYKYYKTFNKLNEKYRLVLTGILAKSAIEKTGLEMHAILKNFAEQIENRFAGEKKEYYYVSVTIRGKLLSKYYYERRKLITNPQQPSNQQTKPKPSVSSIIIKDFGNNEFCVKSKQNEGTKNLKNELNTSVTSNDSVEDDDNVDEMPPVINDSLALITDFDFLKKKHLLDATHGFYKDAADGKLYFGDLPLLVSDLLITIGTSTWPLTEGLFTLLFYKFPKNYSETDLDTYGQILRKSNACRRGGRLRGDRSYKYKYIIQNLIADA